jgi:tRNA (cytidine/uridine-2'-O-)-methyltransferase
VSPKIPQNTGNIGRTCVSLGYRLHIVKPIPYEITDKQLKRAGLDYWPSLDFCLWESLNDFLSSNPITDRHFFFTTKTERSYFDIEFQAGDFLYFGSEDSGLPTSIMDQKKENMVNEEGDEISEPRGHIYYKLHEIMEAIESGNILKCLQKIQM